MRVRLWVGMILGLVFLGAAAGPAIPASKGSSGGFADPCILKMEPIIANLSEPNRYLRVGLAIHLEKPTQVPEAELCLPQIRDSYLLLLGTKTVNELGAMPGKIKLRTELMSRANQNLRHGRVINVYYTEFVVQ